MIRIYGANDDLIEVESNDQSKFRSEEFGYTDPGYGNGETVIAVSDGTLLAVGRDRFGTWRFTPLNQGSAYYGIAHADEDQPSDVVFIKDYPKWIVRGDDVVRTNGR